MLLKTLFKTMIQIRLLLNRAKFKHKFKKTLIIGLDLADL